MEQHRVRAQIVVAVTVAAVTLVAVTVVAVTVAVVVAVAVALVIVVAAVSVMKTWGQTIPVRLLSQLELAGKHTFSLVEVGQTARDAEGAVSLAQ